MINDKYASDCSNEENSAGGDTNEDNCTVVHTLEVTISASDEPDNNSYHSKGEGNTITVDSRNDTTLSSHIHDVNVTCKFYAPFFSSTHGEDITPEN